MGEPYTRTHSSCSDTQAGLSAFPYICAYMHVSFKHNNMYTFVNKYVCIRAYTCIRASCVSCLSNAVDIHFSFRAEGEPTHRRINLVLETMRAESTQGNRKGTATTSCLHPQSTHFPLTCNPSEQKEISVRFCGCSFVKG